MDLHLKCSYSSECGWPSMNVCVNVCLGYYLWSLHTCKRPTACRLYLCFHLWGALAAHMSSLRWTGPKWFSQGAADPVTSTWNVDSAAIGKSKAVLLGVPYRQFCSLICAMVFKGLDFLTIHLRLFSSLTRKIMPLGYHRMLYLFFCLAYLHCSEDQLLLETVIYRSLDIKHHSAIWQGNIISV